MTEAQCAAWEEFRAELPWLNGAHRAIVRVACVLRARLDENPELGVAAVQVYSAVLSKLGATPADEARVGLADDEDPESEEDRFFQ